MDGSFYTYLSPKIINPDFSTSARWLAFVVQSKISWHQLNGLPWNTTIDIQSPLRINSHGSDDPLTSLSHYQHKVFSYSGKYHKIYWMDWRKLLHTNSWFQEDVLLWFCWCSDFSLLKMRWWNFDTDIWLRGKFCQLWLSDFLSSAIIGSNFFYVQYFILCPNTCINA